MPVTKSRLYWFLVAAILITSSLSNVKADEGSPQALTNFPESSEAESPQSPEAKTEATVPEIPTPGTGTTTENSASGSGSPEGDSREENYVAPLNQPNANSVNTVFPPNPNDFDPRIKISPGMLQGLCTDVSVAHDATYCIRSPDICVGSGPAPLSVNCPVAGDTAVMDCLPTLPSFQPQSGLCRAPMNAKCVIVSGDTWGCAYDGYAPQGGYALNQVPPPGPASMPMVNGYPVESSSPSSGPASMPVVNGYPAESSSPAPNPNEQTEASVPAGGSPSPDTTNEGTPSNTGSNEATKPESDIKNLEASTDKGTSQPEEDINKESSFDVANAPHPTIGTQSETEKNPTAAEMKTNQGANWPSTHPTKEIEAEKIGETSPIPNMTTSPADPTYSSTSKKESHDATSPQTFTLESYHSNC